MEDVSLLGLIAIVLGSGGLWAFLTTVFNTTVQKKGLIKEFREFKAECARANILRFADDLLNGVHHSKEYFDQILKDIKRYNDYCSDHPEFPNFATVAATKLIQEQYEKQFMTIKEEIQNETQR